MAVLGALETASQRLRRWWTVDLWIPTPSARGARTIDRFAIHAARTLYIVATGFRTERIKLRAALLTYVSLLSLVPALVVVFSLVTAFAGLGDVEEALKRFVVESLAVTHQETVTQYLEGFVHRAGAIGGFGVAVLVVTAVSLLGNIERAFNDIWGLTRDRTLVQRFQVYWPIITLGPPLIGLSFSLTAAFETSDAVERLVAVTPILGFVFKLLPIGFTWGSLTLVYMLLPNTRVPFRSALIGGVVAGTLWEAAKRLYAVYAGVMLKSPSVYGSLAAVPVSIVWLWVSWVLVLLGATLAFAVQNARTYEPEDQARRRRSQADREFLGLRLLLAVSDSFQRGRGPVSAQALLEQVAAQPRFAHRVLSELAASGLLVEASISRTSEAAYVPGRPLDRITVADVVRAMRSGAETVRSAVLVEPTDALGDLVRRMLLRAESAVDAALGQTSIADLLEPPSAAASEGALPSRAAEEQSG